LQITRTAIVKESVNTNLLHLAAANLAASVGDETYIVHDDAPLCEAARSLLAEVSPKQLTTPHEQGAAGRGGWIGTSV
jgi:hypothetical protein